MVRVDCETRLATQVALVQIHIVVRPIDDFHVDALVIDCVRVVRHDIDRDDRQSVLKRIVPDTERRGVAMALKRELNGIDGCGQH